MSEQNKMLKRRLIEDTWNRGDSAAVDELVASEYLGHSSTPSGETHGREGYKQYFNGLRRAFPDLHFTVEDQFAEGDRVVTRWSASGTHLGEFQGIPPTGKRGAIAGITIDRFANGKIVECWTHADDLRMMQQLGVLPVPGQIGR